MVVDFCLFQEQNRMLQKHFPCCLISIIEFIHAYQKRTCLLQQKKRLKNNSDRAKILMIKISKLFSHYMTRNVLFRVLLPFSNLLITELINIKQVAVSKTAVGKSSINKVNSLSSLIESKMYCNTYAKTISRSHNVLLNFSIASRQSTIQLHPCLKLVKSFVPKIFLFSSLSSKKPTDSIFFL